MNRTRYIYKWHHWCGLIVGVFLLMMSLTGSILVFADEIESVEESNLPQVEAVAGKPSFDASFHQVQALYPGWEIRLYHLPQADKALTYELRKKEQSKKVYVHPVTGRILGVNEDANRSLQRRLLLLHYTWFSGTTGKVLVFFTGVVFLITLITGVIVYRKYFFRVLSFKVKINRKSDRTLYSSLHRIVGVWSLLFNLLMVGSGLWLSGKIALTALEAPAKTAANQQAPARIASVDAVIEKLAAQYPGYEVHLTRVRANTSAVAVSGRFKDDPSWYGKFYSVFSFDGATAEVQSSTFMRDLPASKKLDKMAGPLHFGNYGGLPLKIVYCLLGLSPALLSITGFLLWRKWRKKNLVSR